MSCGYFSLLLYQLPTSDVPSYLKITGILSWRVQGSRSLSSGCLWLGVLGGLKGNTVPWSGSLPQAACTPGCISRLVEALSQWLPLLLLGLQMTGLKTHLDPIGPYINLAILSANNQFSGLILSVSCFQINQDLTNFSQALLTTYPKLLGTQLPSNACTSHAG